MSKQNEFPVYVEHNVQCFNCSGRLDNDVGVESGGTEGNGAYKAYCCKCRMFTFYDVL